MKLLPDYRLSLGMRIFLMSATLIAASLSIVVGLTLQTSQSVAEQAEQESLSSSLTLQNKFRELDEQELLTVIGGFASDPNFSAYIETASIGDGEGGGNVDIASVLDLISERKDDTGLDFIIVLNTEAEVIAHSEHPGFEWTRKDLSENPLVAPVYDELIPVTGIWKDNDEIYQAAAMPLTVDYDVVGFVVGGVRIDNVFVNDIKNIGGSDIIYLLSTDDDEMKPVASTLDDNISGQVIASLTERGEISSQDMETGFQVPVTYNNAQHIVQVQSIGANFEDGSKPLLLTISSTSQYRESYQDIIKVVIAAGLFSTFVALILSYFFSSQTLRPVGELATAAEEASHGKYNRTIEISGKDQLTKLGASINRLLADLREKQDMQHYLTQISHLIPDEQSSGFGESNANQAARIVKLTILAIDTSPILEGSTKASELQSGLETITRETTTMVEVYNGDLYVDVPGQVICAFEGDESDLAGYATAIRIAQKLAPITLRFKSNQAKFAITEGQCLTGTYQLPQGSKAYIYGGPIKQAIRLLQEANPGDCLTTNSIYQDIKSEITKLGVNADSAFGVLSGKRFCSLPLTANAVLQSVRLLQREETTGRGTVSKTLGGGDYNVIKAGATITHRYEVLAILGEGSMGTVLKARDKDLDSMVAIKLLRPDMKVDSESLEQMKSEIKLARQITHQNILRTYDLGDMGGAPFITMEYVRGLTLRNLIANTGKLPYSAGLRVARQLCSGLNAVHEIGVLHRDIKPENIIIELNGNVKLMDFGISRSLDDYKQAHHKDQGMFLGTPRYASPEQMLGQPLTKASDIYACGVVLTELFTGKVPIEGNTFTEISESHVQNPPIPPNVLWPAIPVELDIILLKCLAKNPADRYETTDDLLTELKKLSA